MYKESMPNFFFVFLCFLVNMTSFMSSTSALSYDKEIMKDFDPLDPVYQIPNTKHEPKFGHTWTFEIQFDGWWLAHEALRGELKEMQLVLDRWNSFPSVDESLIGPHHITALQQWWKGHATHMHSHHRNEDNIVRPFVSRRFQWLEFLDKDHHEIIDYIEKIEHRINISMMTKDATTATNLTTFVSELYLLWNVYHQRVLSHLDHEEHVALALLRVYFTPQDIQSMQRQMALCGPRVEVGAIVEYVGVSHLRESMRQQRIPRILQILAWTMVFKPKHRFYCRTMLTPLNILKSV
jgi:Hemerythrin HHE cation binding domain